ncbi:MAG: hypothetical protein HY314_06665 [Acidobacteria bacterium]|nr:hypothetical protein [Acidobacteriota bacterium]
MAEPTATFTPALQLCRHIRTKMMYVMGRAELDLEIPSSTAQYTCLKTLSVIGADGGVVHMDDCQPGRSCFEALD